MVRSIFIFALLVSLSLASPAFAETGWRDLATFFGGHLRGEGQLKNYFDGSTRGVRVDIYGMLEGKTFKMVTNLTYSDGEKQSKIWRFRRVSEGHYIGQRADLVGVADVVVVGNRTNITYVARVPIKGSSVRNLRFDELFLFTQPGRGNYRIRVSLLLLPVAEARLVIRKLPR